MVLLSSLPKKPEAGLSLIEIVLYLGLSGLIIGTIATTGVLIMKGIERTEVAISSAEEAGFITDKINWLLTITSVSTPSPEQTHSQLVLKEVGSNDLVVVKVDGDRLYIERSGENISLPVTTSYSVIRDFTASLSVEHLLTINFRLNDQNFFWYKQLPAQL